MSMKKDYYNELFTRWLNNELSSDELRELKNSPKFSLYQKIAEKSSELDTPSFNEDKVLKNIQIDIAQQKQSKVKKLSVRYITAAASIVILISSFFFVNRTTNYTTNYGEQLSVTLPDNSEVILSTNSSLSYKSFNWSSNRLLQLNGEAFFKVNKGSDFVVETNLGRVKVLGTQFTVNTKENIFETKCFEGKVKVETVYHSKVLTKGNVFRQLDDNTLEEYTINQNNPSWINGESSFNNAPFNQVINALENQYNIKIDATKINTKIKFTGSFTHNNLEIALQTVFIPLSVDYKLIDSKTIVLEKQ